MTEAEEDREMLEERLLDALCEHRIGGGVYPWNLQDCVAFVLVQKNDIAPSQAMTVAENILRQAARTLAQIAE